jgi:hypothetical protein
MGGVEVSKLSSFAQQASSIKMRSGSTYQYLKSIGAECNVLEPSLSKRIQAVSSDSSVGTKLNDTHNVMYKAIDKATTISCAGGDQTFTFSGGEDTEDFINKGDEIVVRGVSYIVDVVNANLTLSVVANDLAFNPTTNYYIITRDLKRNSQGHNKIYALYQPPIGLFDISDNLGQGDFRISLNPNSYYKKAIIQSYYNGLTPDVDYNVVIEDVKFYCYMEKMHIPDGVKSLNMCEMNIQNKNYADNLQFSIPSSTQKISVFLQHPEANYNTKYPPSLFNAVDDADLKIKSIQLTYAGQSKTSTLYESSFLSKGTAGLTSYTNQLQQRFIESYESFSGGVLGSTESYSDWLERGPIFHFNFERDEQSRDTELQVNIQNLSADPTLSNTKVFIVSWYRSQVSYDSRVGVIQTVKVNSL